MVLRDICCCCIRSRFRLKLFCLAAFWHSTLTVSTVNRALYTTSMRYPRTPDFTRQAVVDGLPPPRIHCELCWWRNRCIRPRDNEDAEPDSHSLEDIHSPLCSMWLTRIHEWPAPGSTWYDILMTEKLMAPEQFDFTEEDWNWGMHKRLQEEGSFDPQWTREYLRFPLHGMRKITAYPQRTTCCETPHQDGVHTTKVDVDYVIGRHVTRIENLVRTNTDETNAIPNSRGILHDRGLMNGACTHSGNSGVYLHTYFPTYLVSTGYVALEVVIMHGTRLTTGAKCRLCVNGDFGVVNPMVEVSAVVFNAGEVPDMARLA